MSNTTLIVGESGTGKSTSLRNLDPKETFIINVLDKPLPFRGYKSQYQAVSKENPQGNYYTTDDHSLILRCINSINSRPEIKNLIIDDFQYIMANEFMRRALEKGFEKFSEIGKNAWGVINALTKTRPDLYCFVLSHSDTDIHGKVKCKTIGKMLDNTIALEGMFTIVLHAHILDSKYKFLTQNDGIHTAKSPMGMFDEAYIDNDLSLIIEKMKEYQE